MKRVVRSPRPSGLHQVRSNGSEPRLKKVGDFYVAEPSEHSTGSKQQSYRGHHDLPMATEGRMINLEDREVHDRVVQHQDPSIEGLRTKYDLDQRFWAQGDLGDLDAVVQPPVPASIRAHVEDVGDFRRALDGESVVPQTWEEIGISGEFADVAKEWIGDRPSTVQKDIVPALLHVKDRDIVYSAVTGTGKTVAYLLSLLQLIASEERGVNVIFVPSKQLALQLYSYCLKWTNKGELLGRTDDEWLQLHLQDPNEDEEELKRDYRRLKRTWHGGPRLVIAQPPRWADYLLYYQMNLPIRRIVVDEAFTCFNPIDPVTSPVELRRERSIHANPTDIVMSYYLSFPAYKTLMRAQVVLLTATFTDLLQNHVVRYLKPDQWTHLTTRRHLPFKIRHKFITCDNDSAMSGFLVAAHTQKPKRAVVFVDNNEDLHRAYEDMKESGLNVRLFDVSEGKVPPFQDRSWQYLLMHEQTAYGLDLPDISHVYVLHCPTSKEAYCHMAGRTGRFGAWGDVVSFVEPNTLREWNAHMHLLDIKMKEQSEDLQGNSAEDSVGKQLALLQESDIKEEVQERENALAKSYDKRKTLLYTLAREQGEKWVKTLPTASVGAIMQMNHNEKALPTGPMTNAEVTAFYRKNRTDFVRKAMSLNTKDQQVMTIHPFSVLKRNEFDLKNFRDTYKYLDKGWRKGANRRYKNIARQSSHVVHTIKGWRDNMMLHRFTTTNLAPDEPANTHRVPPVSRPLHGGKETNKWANMADLPAYPGQDVHKETMMFDHEGEALRIASQQQEPVITPASLGKASSA